jgi:hypothetical protein
LARDANVPRLRRLPVLGSSFREYSLVLSGFELADHAARSFNALLRRNGAENY